LDEIYKNGVILNNLNMIIGCLKLKTIKEIQVKRRNDETSISQYIVTNYITVSSIDEYASRIGQSGGKVTIPKKEIPDMGFFAICLDSENNIFGIYEDNKSTT
jgi:hypothetical protein